MPKPYDFKALLTKPLDPDLQMEKEDLAWAAYGRAVHRHLTGERFVAAVTTAILAGVCKTNYAHHTAACIRSFLMTGTITR